MILHAWHVGVWQLLMVGGVMLLGLLGVIVPGVPGPWLVWAAVLWWSLHVQTGVAWFLLVGATAVLLINQVIVWLLPNRRLRGLGVTRRMAASAGLGALAGFFLIPVIGAVPGFVGGIYGSERLRLGGHGPAMASTRAVMRAAGTSVLVELMGCLMVVG
ncbi:small hydrophobic protein, partial [Streptomyces pristinaespiralis ATCC 25486]